MEKLQVWPEKLKKFYLNNKFVVVLLILLLIGINILVFSKVPFIFKPISVLLHTVAAPLLLSGIAYYLLNPLVDLLVRKSRIKRVYAIAPDGGTAAVHTGPLRRTARCSGQKAALDELTHACRHRATES